MIRTAWTLTRKDLRLFFRDRPALLLTLALPLLLATVFGSACSGLNPAPAISFSGSVTPNHFGTVHLTGAPPGGTAVLVVGDPQYWPHCR